MAKIIKVLLLEDNHLEATTLEETKSRIVEQYNSWKTDGNSINIEFNHYTTITKEVYEKIFTEDYDFMVIDLKLDDDVSNWSLSWQDFIHTIFRNLHTPIIINTGNIADIDQDIIKENILLRIFDSWEEDSSDKIIQYMLDIYSTGITKVVGRDWLIESTLTDLIFKGGLSNISKRIDNWEWIDGVRSLWRYILSHIQSWIDNDYKDFHIEETYITVKWTETSEVDWISRISIKNWRIINKDWINYVVISPACDLAQKKHFKFILLQIDHLDVTSIQEAKATYLNPTNNSSKIRKALRHINNFKSTQEWWFWFLLPKTSLFNWGIVNFKKVVSIDPSDEAGKKCLYLDNYQIVCDMAPLFIKDLIPRFSSYYARQWTPDRNIQLFIKSL